MEVEMFDRLIALIVVAAWCSVCAAQTTVYETQDKKGPVFSDRPLPDSKAIDLGAPNVIDVTPVAPAPPAAQAAPPPYSALAVTAPARGATLHTNTGAFTAGVKATPALRAGAGDRVRVALDGYVLPTRYRSTSIHITSADWQAAASDNVEHTLQVAIVDQAGMELVRSEPVTFYEQRATVRRAPAPLPADARPSR
jgi:hypothetical protein